MLTSEVAVLKYRHGISVKCSRYRDIGPTNPSLVPCMISFAQMLLFTVTQHPVFSVADEQSGIGQHQFTDSQDLQMSFP